MSREKESSSTSSPYRVYGATTLGVALRHFRKEARLTQQELADLTGLHRSYLSELEVGKETEQVRRLSQVPRQLGVRISHGKAEW